MKKMVFVFCGFVLFAGGFLLMSLVSKFLLGEFG